MGTGTGTPPCTACSWSTERQEACRYHSHVKLTHAVSDRGVWSVGSQLVIKERSTAPPNYEASNLRFLKKHTNLPVPAVLKDWSEDGRHFIINERLPGQPLNVAWPSLSPDERHRVAKQTADYITELRKLQSPRIQSLTEEPVYSTFLFLAGQGVPHGPFESDKELWDEMDKALEKVPKKARRRLQERMPAAVPFTFTHGDLTNVNIMVENGNLTGIIDWETGGYFPVWWEFTSASVGRGEEDKEWKTLLQEYMPPFAQAREFWLDFYSLSKYPKLDSRAKAFFENLETP